MQTSVSVLWAGGGREGAVRIDRGTLVALGAKGTGVAAGSQFRLPEGGPCGITIRVADAELGPGAGGTIVMVEEKEQPFSFWLRDVSAEYPIYVEPYGVVVTTADDERDYQSIVAAVSARRGRSALETAEAEPEESFEAAASLTREMSCPTWLGLSRDVKIFEAGFRYITIRGGGPDVWDWVRPRFHGLPVTLPELGDQAVRYDFLAGRGLGCVQGLERWLEERTLPILNARHTDGDVHYAMKYFVTLERSPLVEASIRGTHILVADHFSAGSMLTPEQTAEMERLLPGEIDRDEEPVITIVVQALNTASAPRYSWMRIPCPANDSGIHGASLVTEYDVGRGFGSFTRDRVYLVATLDGKPVPQREMAVLLRPGEKAEYVFRIPHRPVSEQRAARLAASDWHEKLDECVRFWKAKGAKAASVSLPEPRIEEMIRAGTHHLDLVCYGREPDGAVAPVVGVYSPIGSESSPIIQFLDSIGCTDLARRAIAYFLEKQHADGFMQNFGGYMLETGAVLWDIGEHYRYTRDSAWARSVTGGVLKACDYIIRWRERNKREELRGKGYGMIDGKVADPEDPYHAYMLNGFACVGLARAAELLGAIGRPEAVRIGEEARLLLADVRAAYARSVALSPVVPLGNGRWCPSVSPWVESRGPLALHAESGDWFTHASVSTRDTLIGSMYLLIQEVLGPSELYADFLLQSFSELFFLRNVAFSQPYYSPHPYAHLRRGEVGAFLKEFYNNVSSIADRETYTFWEHYHHASPHKTHEEAWFLMRCRWMLYMEGGEKLRLLPGVPRAWLRDGKSITVEGMRSYFGSLSFRVESEVDKGRMRARFSLRGNGSTPPRLLAFRLPHPEGERAVWTSTGRYDARSESVLVEPTGGEIALELRF